MVILCNGLLVHWMINRLVNSWTQFFWSHLIYSWYFIPFLFYFNATVHLTPSAMGKIRTAYCAMGKIRISMRTKVPDPYSCCLKGMMCLSLHMCILLVGLLFFTHSLSSFYPLRDLQSTFYQRPTPSNMCQFPLSSWKFSFVWRSKLSGTSDDVCYFCCCYFNWN